MNACFRSQRHQPPGRHRRVGDQLHAPCLGQRRQHQEPFPASSRVRASSWICRGRRGLPSSVWAPINIESTSPVAPPVARPRQ
jgi:hypothetical protein